MSTCLVYQCAMLLYQKETLLKLLIYFIAHYVLKEMCKLKFGTQNPRGQLAFLLLLYCIICIVKLLPSENKTDCKKLIECNIMYAMLCLNISKCTKAFLVPT